jgi:hypothetical protein
MHNLFGISMIGLGLLSLWPICVLGRRWWIKPYRNPSRVLTRIRRSLRLSGAEVRHLKTLLGSNQDPTTMCQFLLDPTRWPVASQDEMTKKLYAKVFKEP